MIFLQLVMCVFLLTFSCAELTMTYCNLDFSNKNIEVTTYPKFNAISCRNLFPTFDTDTNYKPITITLEYNTSKHFHDLSSWLVPIDYDIKRITNVYSGKFCSKTVLYYKSKNYTKNTYAEKMYKVRHNKLVGDEIKEFYDFAKDRTVNYKMYLSEKLKH